MAKKWYSVKRRIMRSTFVEIQAEDEKAFREALRAHKAAPDMNISCVRYYVKHLKKKAVVTVISP